MCRFEKGGAFPGKELLGKREMDIYGGERDDGWGIFALTSTIFAWVRRRLIFHPFLLSLVAPRTVPPGEVMVPFAAPGDPIVMVCCGLRKGLDDGSLPPILPGGLLRSGEPRRWQKQMR